MKKIIAISSLVLLTFTGRLHAQATADTSVYLITCGAGTETYSIYGHSAIRVIIASSGSDIVYNWGVFDFETPNFAWKFAKGRLDYMLDTENLTRFLQEYYYEKRFVWSQKLNLDRDETKKMLGLINENLKPENVKYRYDFFYDDCSTRIRDLIEKSAEEKLLYPPPENVKSPSFREMVSKYQNPFPWLKFGVDLIMGSPGDKKASYRDRMFLPLDLQRELSETVLNRSGKMIPLLQNPAILLNFEPPVIKFNFLTSPSLVFTLVLIIVLILSALVNNPGMIKLFDVSVFSIFSVLALLMIFFNFFTDHVQMKWNLNIIWLNPLILFCLGAIILNKPGSAIFKILFYILILFLFLQILLPQDFNIAFIPLILILIIRSSVRAGFTWSPFYKRLGGKNLE